MYVHSRLFDIAFAITEENIVSNMPGSPPKERSFDLISGVHWLTKIRIQSSPKFLNVRSFGSIHSFPKRCLGAWALVHFIIA